MFWNEVGVHSFFFNPDLPGTQAVAGGPITVFNATKFARCLGCLILKAAPGLVQNPVGRTLGERYSHTNIFIFTEHLSGKPRIPAGLFFLKNCPLDIALEHCFC